MLRRRRRHPSREPNYGGALTPLADVLFTLTIFYMLISRFVAAEQVPMQLPSPRNSLAEVESMPQRVVINCRLGIREDGSTEVHYAVGPNPPESLDAIAERLIGWKRESPAMDVVIRADRRLPYREVRDLMRLAASAGFETLHVTALTEEER